MTRSFHRSTLVAFLVLALGPGAAQAQPVLATPPNPYDAPPPAPPVAPAPVVQPAPLPAPLPAGTRVGVTCVAPDGAPTACPQVVVVATGPTTVYGSAPARERPDPGPTPAGGFLGRRSSLQMRLELGYPFLDLGVDYVFAGRFSLGVGMRSLYSMSFAPYVNARAQLAQNASRTVGLSLGLKAGYTLLRSDDYDGETTEMLIGGSGAFGELSLTASARRRSHGLFVGAGLRVSQRSEYAMAGCYDGYCDDGYGSSSGKAVVTAFTELGWEVRVGHHASYYLGVGVDMFVNSGLPAMIRFRNGVIIDF